MLDFLSKNWAGIAGILALLTSVVSNVIAYYTFKLQRTHNIKSVKPILQIGQWDYENNISVDLRNAGSGVAIVTGTTTFDHLDNHKNCIYDWLPKKLPSPMNYKAYWVATKDYVIQPGQIVKLIDIPIDTSVNEQKIEREKLRSVLRQLTGLLIKISMIILCPIKRCH